MNIYFDTEFTGLVPGTTLISIGCITENNDCFYAEFTDYDKSKVDDWIQKNVIDNLIFKDKDFDGHDWHNFMVDAFGGEYAVDSCGRGTSEDVLRELKEWLDNVSNHGEESIQFISDVCHYDFTLLSNLFGGAFSLPDYVNSVCYDICQDIAKELLGEKTPLSESMAYGFDIDRENFLTVDLNGFLPKGKKHNALYDAFVIKKIYERMRRN